MVDERRTLQAEGDKATYNYAEQGSLAYLYDYFMIRRLPLVIYELTCSSHDTCRVLTSHIEYFEIIITHDNLITRASNDVNNKNVDESSSVCVSAVLERR